MLDQKLKQNYNGGTIQTEKIARTIIESVDRFAPETFIKLQNNGNDWVTNKVENAVTKRDELSLKWVSGPSNFNRKHMKNSAIKFFHSYETQKWKPISTNLDKTYLQHRCIER